jgi:hypothetical protein
MRSIAGQILRFSFHDVAAGVIDPTFKDDVEALFLSAWSAQILSGAAFVRAVPEAANVGGNEHLGMRLGDVATLSELTADVPIPPGASFGFAFSIDSLVDHVNDLWGVATVSGGRVNADGLPDPKGASKLETMKIVASGSLWTISIGGVYLSPADLPNVPFKISWEEGITAVDASDSPSFTLTHNAYPAQLNADFSALDSAITALEVFGVGAVGSLTAGPFAPFLIPGIAAGNDALHEYISSQVTPVSTPFLVLKPVYDAMVQRLPLPGTLTDLWFKFNAVTFPPGVVAELKPFGRTGTILTSQMPGAAIMLSGRKEPVRLRREGLVIVVGPSTVRFPAAFPHATSQPVRVEIDYVAYPSDDAVNPTFQWSVRRANGEPLRGVTMVNAGARTVTVQFTKSDFPEPTTQLELVVVMDDAQHLKAADGRMPSGGLTLSVVRDSGSAGSSKPGGDKKLQQLP